MATKFALFSVWFLIDDFYVFCFKQSFVNNYIRILIEKVYFNRNILNNYRVVRHHSIKFNLFNKVTVSNVTHPLHIYMVQHWIYYWLCPWATAYPNLIFHKRISASNYFNINLSEPDMKSCTYTYEIWGRLSQSSKQLNRKTF